ncbi:UDP-glycosyltransferase 74E1 [Forsythia ovata]|uniref:Glycosyltransferase n=1 Tax=Forsythia ovata TaxID=205694 RepID=A0ABD1RNA6_9LAMI
MAVKEDRIVCHLLWVVSFYCDDPNPIKFYLCYQTHYLDPSIIGMLYDRLGRSIPMRRLVGIVQFLYASSLLLDLVIVKQIIVQLEISNEVFALCFSSLAETIAQFKLLPFLVLFANLAPPGCKQGESGNFKSHINPMLQFAKRLRHKRIKITLAVTKFLFNTMQEFPDFVSMETISDGFDEGGRAHAGSLDEYLERFGRIGTKTLMELVEKLKNLDCAIDCIIFDPFLSWGFEVAKKSGLLGALFFTQSCAVDNIYYHVYTGKLKLPLSDSEIVIPGLPPLEPKDMPSVIYIHESHPAALKMLVNQVKHLGEADWTFVNSFYELEQEVIDSMAKFSSVKTIGPTIPSMYIDKQLQDDKEYGLSIFKPITDACKKWLNEQTPRSVIYVSFGSLAELGLEQMEELAKGLKASNKYFLWVVRASEESKLPKIYAEETLENGLIVSWCPQLEVLAHDAVGCFITHCGWNSTLEALSLGVPMVAMPCWTDQSTNAKFVNDVWKTGIRTQPDEKGIVRNTEIVRCVEFVMDRDEGKEIRTNAIKWKEMAREAVDKGGSSDTNIDEFLSALMNPPI